MCSVNVYLCGFPISTRSTFLLIAYTFLCALLDFFFARSLVLLVPFFLAHLSESFCIYIGQTRTL